MTALSTALFSVFPLPVSEWHRLTWQVPLSKAARHVLRQLLLMLWGEDFGDRLSPNLHW